MNLIDEIKKTMLLNIQLFAEKDQEEDNQDNANNQEKDNKNNGEDKDEQSKPEKKYTDDDVNSISKKNSDKATKKLMKDLGIEDIEEAKQILANARAEKEKNMTPEDKNNDLNKAMDEKESLIAKKNNQLVSALLENQLMHEGIKSDKIARAVKMINAKDVLNEDEEVDNELIKKEIGKLLKEFPEFKTKSEEEETKKGFKFGSDGKQDNDKTNNKPNPSSKRWNRFN